MVKQLFDTKGDATDRLEVLGVVEVKSMSYSKRKILQQIDTHIARLSGGVRLGAREWAAGKLVFKPFKKTKKAKSNLLRVMVMPSQWKLKRDWVRVQTDRGKDMVFPEPIAPPMKTEFTEIEPGCWHITLAWSQEALSQAAYEMTFWYMSEVGRHVYEEKKLPQEWSDMSPGEAGCNAIKMMLYYIMLRHLSNRQQDIATRLYNVYSFGYPLGVDSKKMLWPEDFPEP